MKTKLTINIETPDLPEIFPEEGQSDEDFEGEDKQKELAEFRKDYATDLHNTIINSLKYFIQEGRFEESCIDNMNDVTIEDYDSFDDYEIKVSIEEAKDGLINE
jgi:hypothetical protein